MIEDYVYSVAINLAAAVVAGGLIGLERSFHGRPAGFRTHTMVCMTSSLLMLVTLHQDEWLPRDLAEFVRTDPSRMAQGILTGIGFLGAGVIYKEGPTVRGLTTASSIWLTAAVGIALGVGFYVPAAIATAMSLVVLTVLRWFEDRMPTQAYAHHKIRFHRDETVGEDELRGLLAEHGFRIAYMSYRLVENGEFFEYRMVIRTTDPLNSRRLADALRKVERVREFSISPTGD